MIAVVAGTLRLAGTLPLNTVSSIVRLKAMSVRETVRQRSVKAAALNHLEQLTVVSVIHAHSDDDGTRGFEGLLHHRNNIIRRIDHQASCAKCLARSNAVKSMTRSYRHRLVFARSRI